MKHEHEFILKTELTLNSNTIFFSCQLPSTDLNVEDFVYAYISNGQFFLDAEYGKWKKTDELEVKNLQLKLEIISFDEFHDILLDMLITKRVHFHEGPYGTKIDEGYARELIGRFTNYLNIDNEKEWTFYTMPRDYVNSSKEELDFLHDMDTHYYRPMGEANKENPLGKYFHNLGYDAFLIFHNGKDIFFLLTNGSD